MKIRIFAILLSAAVLCSCWTEEVHVTSITLDAKALTIAIGSSDKINATLSPANADNKVVIWSSSDASVARVESDGTVTAVAPGSAVITAKADDGGLSDDCVVTVPEVLVPVESVSLSPEALTLQKGAQESAFTCTVSPADATNKAVRWSSSNEAVLFVDADGVVTALETGTASVLVTTVDGGFTASCVVNVVQPVKTMELSKTELSLKLYAQERLSVTFSPEDAVNTEVNWTSGDETVATVYNGMVTARGVGETVITASSKEDPTLSATCKVTVTCDVTAVTLKDHNITLQSGDTATLEYTVSPSYATDKSVRWSSSDENCVVVVDGVITAKAHGTAVITVTSVSDESKTDACTVKVESGVSSLSIKEKGGSVVESTKLYVGETIALEAVVGPEDAAYHKITWESVDPRVATVDDQGVVTAVAKGTTAICAVADDGKHASCIISVSNRVQSVKVSTADNVTKIDVGDTLPCSCEFEADGDVSGIGVLWSVSDESVASVDSKGVVTGKAKGDVTVTATTNDKGQVSGSIKITVIQPITEVSLDKTNVEMWEGETETVSVTLGPAAATDYTYLIQEYGQSPMVPGAAVISYSSNGGTSSVSTVSVTAKSAGTTQLVFRPNTPKAGVYLVASCFFIVKAHVKSIAIQEDDLTRVLVAQNGTKRLGVSVEPSYAENQSVTWTSSDPSVASVDDNGIVTGHKAGASCTITAVSKDNSNAVSSCTVFVPNAVNSITLNKTSLDIMVEETFQLTYEVDPQDTPYKDVIWTSSNPSVASVASDGIVTGVAASETPVTITATSVATPSVSASCTVYVSPQVVKVRELSFSPDTYEIFTGDVKDLGALISILPANAENKEIEWTTNDADVASVNASTGRVRGLSKGTAIITATSKGNPKVKAYCTIIVKEAIIPVQKVTISGSKTILDLGESTTLTATVEPSNATDKTVKWTSSDPTIATVTEDGGVVTAGDKAGTVDITAYSVAYPYITDVYKIQVLSVIHPTGISLNANSITVYVNETVTLNATVYPEEATNKNVVWDIAQGGFAGISQNGTVTGIREGKTVVFATTEDGGHMVSCTVIVKINKVTDIDVQPSTSLTLKAGETFDIVATAVGEVSNHKVSYGDLEWSSNDDSIATVSEKGRITAVSPGTATITIQSAEVINDVKSTVNRTVTVKVLSSGPGNNGNEGVEYDDWNF